MDVVAFMDYLATELETDRTDWSLTANLVDDIGLDSLGLTVLLVVLRELGVELDEVAVPSLVTVGDVFALYDAAVPHRAPRGSSSASGAPLLLPTGDGRGNVRSENVVLSGPLVTLRPPRPADTEYLYSLATAPDTGWRWRFRGRAPTNEEFLKMLWDGCLTQYLVVRTASGERIGLVQAIRPSREGYAYITVLTAPEYMLTGLMFEGLGLFVNYLFTNWDHHHLYAEVPAYNYELFDSGLGRLFQVYGHFPDHDYALGKRWDMYVVGISRERWLTEIAPRFISTQARRPSVIVIRHPVQPDLTAARAGRPNGSPVNEPLL
jgi:acyl carrier protein/RimJ/RimL family protein N-acetyltransferase